MMVSTQFVALKMSESLALFSLPLLPLGTVLFPEGLLPLRIFEVRYLDMIGKCYKAGAPFGVVTLSQGTEVRHPAATENQGFMTEKFHGVGTLATISTFSNPQAGLMLIQCKGTERLQVSEQQQLKHGLWLANVTLLASDLPVNIPDDLKGVATALGNLINTLHAHDVPQSSMPVRPPYKLHDCSWVANRWCELLPMSLVHRQLLMSLDNPLVRLELVSDLLARNGIST